MEYVLQTKGLCKAYGRFKALDHLDMNIPKGAIYGFVGQNGAGKTTLMRLICGLQKPTGGDYALYGKSREEQDIDQARSRMAAVVETPAFYLHMTARENLKQQYLMLGMPSDEGIEEILRLVGLEGTGKKKAKHFSLGMRQRLGIAVALCGRPDFLVLDEPVNGLDPQGIIEIRELILKLNQEQGITFLISSHILDELSRIATHYGFISRGRMLQEVSAEELQKSCRKYKRVRVSDTKALCRALDASGMEYHILSDEEAEIYGQITAGELVLALQKEHCELLTLTEKEDSLESYFINLTGGSRDE